VHKGNTNLTDFYARASGKAFTFRSSFFSASGEGVRLFYRVCPADKGVRPFFPSFRPERSEVEKSPPQRCEA
jgi:hypothetical protein